MHPGYTKTSMNPGRFTFSIPAEAHAKAVIDKLGWEIETFGHWKHGFRHYIREYAPFYALDESINNGIKKVILQEKAEQEKKKLAS